MRDFSIAVTASQLCRCRFILLLITAILATVHVLFVMHMTSWDCQNTAALDRGSPQADGASSYTRSSRQDNVSSQQAAELIDEYGPSPYIDSFMPDTDWISNTTAADEPTRRSCPSEFKLPYVGLSYFKQKAQEPSKNNRTDYRILILTPFADTVGTLIRYFQLVCSLTYPHDKITIALGEDSDLDAKTLQKSLDLADQLRPSFADVVVYKLTPRDRNWPHKKRHDINVQLMRRGHMAKARNDLLFRALREEHDWVIWIDCDLHYIPPNLIQLLLSPNQPIVAPLCAMGLPNLQYDLNTWRETNKSREYISKQKTLKGDDFLMLEGYGNDSRMRLVDIRYEGAVVRVDGVGGCALLVNASCHRQGLIFPSFVFDSHIETEGLAKMATKMGIPMYGLPYVNIYHAVE